MYKDILTCVHEKNFQSPLNNSSSYQTNQIDTPIVMTTLKSLSILYRRQGFYDAAEIMDNCASRARKDSQAIIQALNTVQEVRHL